MKARLQALAKRIDERTLRERIMLFAAFAAALVFLLFALTLNPLMARRAALQAELGQQRDAIAVVDDQIGTTLQAFTLDPNAAGNARLAAVDGETVQLSTSLRAMQMGLVAPERITALLDSILAANGRLQLLSMTTLPPSPFSDGAFAPKARAAVAPAAPEMAMPAPAPAAETAAPAAAPAAPPEMLYRHGVELTVRGNYLDMVNYMDALEAMPTQLFWGQAALQVEDYPSARLTLTLYTLSLDRKWIKL